MGQGACNAAGWTESSGGSERWAPPESAIESRYEAPRWEATAYAPGSDARWIALGKIARALGSARALRYAHPWWEACLEPGTGPRRGGRTSSDHVLECDFEITAGVDVDRSTVLGPEHRRLLHEACAPEHARFVLRRRDGTPLELEPGDRLVPTTGSPPVPVRLQTTGGYVDPRSGRPIANRDVVWRIRRRGRLVVPEHEWIEGRRRLLGLAEGVAYRPPVRWRVGGAWRTAWWGRGPVGAALDASGRAAPRRAVRLRERGERDAEVWIGPGGVTALLAHLGFEALTSHVRFGARWWGVAGGLRLQDGGEVRGWITRVWLEDGAVWRPVQRVGEGWRPGAGSLPVGWEPVRRTVMDGAGRRVALCVLDWERAGPGVSRPERVEVVTAAGTPRTVAGDELAALAWEDVAGMPPWILWRLHEHVGPHTTLSLDRDGGLHPWASPIRWLRTEPIEESRLEPHEAARLGAAGAWRGTQSAEGVRRLYETRADHSVWRYAVWCDATGRTRDFLYLGHDRPWLVWGAQVRDTAPWPGESDLPGVPNEALRRLWSLAVRADEPAAVADLAAPGDRAPLPARSGA